MSDAQKSRLNLAQRLLRRIGWSGTEDVKSQFGERIALCTGTLRSNCIGTALYIIGEQKEDSYVHPYLDIQDLYLKELKPTQIPSKDCLIVWGLHRLYCAYGRGNRRRPIACN